MQWGGPLEQAQEIANGNRDAKDWQAEALRVVEETVRSVCNH
jgi:hAT family C-terminal dimerisation region